MHGKRRKSTPSLAVHARLQIAQPSIFVRGTGVGGVQPPVEGETAAVGAGGNDNATALVVDVVGLADDRPYDSDAQRVSLEQKLGALP